MAPFFLERGGGAVEQWFLDHGLMQVLAFWT